MNEDTVHMIMAYYPNTDKWEEDMKTRGKNNGLFYVQREFRRKKK